MNRITRYGLIIGICFVSGYLVADHHFTQTLCDNQPLKIKCDININSQAASWNKEL